MASIPPPLSMRAATETGSSSYPLSSSYRRRLGRAASPPTWTWYEHITPAQDDDSERESRSGSDASDDDDEDDDEEEGDEDGSDGHEHAGFEMELDPPALPPVPAPELELELELEAGSVEIVDSIPVPAAVAEAVSSMEVDDTTPAPAPAPASPPPPPPAATAPAEPPASPPPAAATPPTPPPAPAGGECTPDAEREHDEAVARKLSAVAKGKQRAVAPPSPATSRKTSASNTSSRRRTAARNAEPAYRPILTIHRSHGFVWNQDLFVPAYIKDRYVTSTSPPTADSCVGVHSHTSSPSANGNAGGAPFDPVDVVEIRVTGSELDDWDL